MASLLEIDGTILFAERGPPGGGQTQGGSTQGGSTQGGPLLFIDGGPATAAATSWRRLTTAAGYFPFVEQSDGTVELIVRLMDARAR